jgi:hypothetical protein
MRRREFMALLGGATSWPIPARVDANGTQRTSLVLQLLHARDKGIGESPWRRFARRGKRSRGSLAATGSPPIPRRAAKIYCKWSPLTVLFGPQVEIVLLRDDGHYE